MRKLWAIIGSLVLATASEALVVGGGGAAASDCLSVLVGAANVPATRPRHIACVDGEACDGDGTVDGVCSIALAVCANSTFSPQCMLAGVQAITVEHAADNGDPLFDPSFQALQTRIDNEIAPPSAAADVCTISTNILVPIKGPFARHRCSKGKKKIRLTTLSRPIGGEVFTDRDLIKLMCLPAALNGCDPRQLFSATFDRVQRQVFNQGCALSGCHDSQTLAGGLLLETGASYGNLVNAGPANTAAAAAGWNRVTPGSAEQSFLFHKLSGDLTTSMGGRMPLDRRRLNPALVEMIRLWIEGGAPQAGWVPGTD